MIRCSTITGAGGPARKVALGRHSYDYGFGRVPSPVIAACKLGEGLVQCSTRSYTSRDSIRILFRLRELEISGSGFTPMFLPPGQLSRTLTKGGAGWILTPSLNQVALGARSSAGRAHLRGEIADVAGSFGNSLQREGKVASGIALIGDVESPTTVGDFGAEAKLDFFQGIKDVFKRAETLKEDVASLDFGQPPTPFSPNEGPDSIKFALLTVTLLFIFWLGNFYVPDLIFKRTVFNKSDEPDDPNDKASDEKMLTMSNQESSEDSAGATKSKTDASERSTSQVGTGFGRSKERRFRRSKRK